MVQINFALKEVNCKIVYYGPGMSGKTTNLEIVHQKAPEENKGDLTSISTDGDRTLFFDFMPLDLGNIAGMRTKFQLYTVPGQVYYNSTRKLVLQGVDGVIFVADSDPEKMEENIESFRNLEENLKEYGKDLADLPHVIQYNKRDLPNAMPIEEMDKKLNKYGVPTFEAVAVTGEGVFPTLKVLASMALETINKIERPGAKPKTTSQLQQKTTTSPRHEVKPKHEHTSQGHSPKPQAKQVSVSHTRQKHKPQPLKTKTRDYQKATPQVMGRTKRTARYGAKQEYSKTGKSSSGILVALILFLIIAAAGAGFVLFFMNG